MCFNSKCWVPGTEGVNEFAYDWNGDWTVEVNWLVPPIYLIDKAITHAAVCRYKEVLIAPAWKSATF